MRIVCPYLADLWVRVTVSPLPTFEFYILQKIPNLSHHPQAISLAQSVDDPTAAYLRFAFRRALAHKTPSPSTHHIILDDLLFRLPNRPYFCSVRIATTHRDKRCACGLWIDTAKTKIV